MQHLCVCLHAEGRCLHTYSSTRRITGNEAIDHCFGQSRYLTPISKSSPSVKILCSVTVAYALNILAVEILGVENKLII
ncbi:hypothetical protein CEXT_69661 [Caerostris extrusa]|uniref:Uncharacterized protein n=1 Tax=Caerostris extrusa TaxID=172846 RepID=A0AAV4TGF8_CAEEX|nr:hypothetical protein CEXT_69661 [Caerostris extrusa]